MRFEKSCGAVLFAREDASLRYLIIRHTGGHCGFPKGHTEAGESEQETALREIRSAIDSLRDERQKEVLTRRYITGQGFKEIREAMHYEETQIFVIHGRGLLEVNKWLSAKELRRDA